MRPEDFISFQDEKPEKKKWIVVTNNIKAENAFGEMSHVWLVNFYAENAGIFVTFDDNDSQISHLSHWKYV